MLEMDAMIADAGVRRTLGLGDDSAERDLGQRHRSRRTDRQPDRRPRDARRIRRYPARAAHTLNAGAALPGTFRAAKLHIFTACGIALSPATSDSRPRPDIRFGDYLRTRPFIALANAPWVMRLPRRAKASRAHEFLRSPLRRATGFRWWRPEPAPRTRGPEVIKISKCALHRDLPRLHALYSCVAPQLAHDLHARGFHARRAAGLFSQTAHFRKDRSHRNPPPCMSHA